MTRDVARASLYRGAINLWVEDEITRAYLAELWNDTSIAYFIGGGHDGVKAIVQDASNAGYLNVFGLIDRDDRRSNYVNWNNSRKTFRTFVLPVHEIENYLLDSEALAANVFNNRSLTKEEIEKHLVDEAALRLSWVACRRVISLLRKCYRGRFLTDPPRPENLNEEAAYSHICESAWFRSLSRRVTSLNAPKIAQLLSIAHVKAQIRIDDGSWRDDFAGKELFHHIGSKIFDQTKPPIHQFNLASFHVDLAKGIAAWQVENKIVPPSLNDLRAALRQRITQINESKAGGL